MTEKQKKNITLLVKHLPNEIPEEKIIELFTHYGAIHVKWMKNSMKMKGMAFVECPSKQAAETIYNRFNNLKFKEKILSVEYVKEKSPQKKEENQILEQTKREPISEKLGFKYESNPNLHYKYPNATPQIVSNIANALLAVPKFYTQVLHLMNKMNLPPPFGTTFPQVPHEDVQNKSKKRKRLDLSSDESEIESDEEEDRMKKIKLVDDRVIRVKNIVEKPQQQIQIEEEKKEEEKKPIIEIKLQDTHYGPKILKALTDEELREGKLSHEELIKIKPKLKDYTPGPVSKKLYIKNLKQNVSMEDLKYCFARYFQSEEEMKKYSLFGIFSNFGSNLEIKILTGRMRGNAFVTFQNEELSKKAIEELHGFQLKGKPMIIYFGKK